MMTTQQAYELQQAILRAKRDDGIATLARGTRHDGTRVWGVTASSRPGYHPH